MKTLFRTAAGLITAMLLVFMPLVSVSAQPSLSDTVFTSEITGEDIELGNPDELQFSPDDYDLSINDTFQEEYIWIWSMYSSFELILIDGPTDAEDYTDITLSNMESFYDSWELLGTESDLDIAWFLGVGEIDGNELYVYYEYEVDVFGDVDFAYMQFSSDIDLIPDMQLSQELITVGGLSVPLNPDFQVIADLTGMPYDGVESTPEDEEETTTGTSSRTSRTSSTSTDTTTEQTGTTSRTSRTGTSTTDTTTEQTGTVSRTSRTTSVDADETNESETSGNKGSRADRTSTTATTDDETADGGWADLGLIDDDAWESPTHGVIVDWDTTLWEFPVDYDSAIIIGEDGWESLTLQTTDGLGYVFLSVDYAGDSTPRSLLDYWESDDYLSGLGPDPVIVESARTRDTASIIYTTTNLAEEPILVILDASFQEDGTVVFTQLTAAPETIATVYAAYVDGVAYDGGPVNLTWDVEEIEDLQP